MRLRLGVRKGLKSMENEQKHRCVFAFGGKGLKCRALTEYVCDKRECPFFKDLAEWHLTPLRSGYEVRGGETK